MRDRRTNVRPAIFSVALLAAIAFAGGSPAGTARETDDPTLGVVAADGGCLAVLSTHWTGTGFSAPESALTSRFPEVADVERVDLAPYLVRFDVYEGDRKDQAYLVRHNGSGWLPVRGVVTSACGSAPQRFHQGVIEPAAGPR